MTGSAAPTRRKGSIRIQWEWGGALGWAVPAGTAANSAWAPAAVDRVSTFGVGGVPGALSRVAPSAVAQAAQRVVPGPSSWCSSACRSEPACASDSATTRAMLQDRKDAISRTIPRCLGCRPYDYRRACPWPPLSPVILANIEPEEFAHRFDQKPRYQVHCAALAGKLATRCLAETKHCPTLNLVATGIQDRK